MVESAPLSSRVVAAVVPLIRVRSLGDRRFDYVVPHELIDGVKVGSVVGVQFSGRSARGVVVGLVQAGPVLDAELKSVDFVEDQSISTELMDLAESLASRYIAPLESCLRLVVPPRPGKVGSRSQSFATAWVFRVRRQWERRRV